MGSAFQYPDYATACKAVNALGESLARGTPVGPKLSPLTFTFTGNGNCSKGAQEVFNHLGAAAVMLPTVQDLQQIVKAGDAGDPGIDRSKVYGFIAEEEDFVAKKDGSAWENGRAEYYNHPERFTPTFYKEVAPYTSCLMNTGYWDARYPRLLTTEQMRDMSRAGESRLLMVGDVSCDIGGSVEFFYRDTQVLRLPPRAPPACPLAVV
jgi:alpha-aminoadipic semialdehyde synthase